MKDFFMNNTDFLITVVVFVVGLLLPNPKINSFGKKIGEKIPGKLKIELANKLDAFEQGLRGKNVNGDSSITSNEQITQEVDKLKIDLGLKE